MILRRAISFGAAVGFACALWPMPLSAQTRLVTNEADIAEVLRSVDGAELNLSDPNAMFGVVFDALPERVQVLPTENYYYFRFLHRGVGYSGNIRLAAADRDQGRLHFAYGEQPSDWRSEISINYSLLDAERGVKVEKVDAWTYRVTRGDKSVIFALNDVSAHKPPEGLLAADETLIGPITDESALRFFLVFNARLKVFHYLLDETARVPDEFVVSRAGDRIIVGKRTGFAFFMDGTRKILIGVHQRNSVLNTPFDGPFDQLPENLIQGDELRDAIVAVAPEVKGKIDRFGSFLDRQDRYLVHPFMLYRAQTDLAVFQRCATDKRVRAEDRGRCFVIDDDEAQKKNPRPAALKRR